MADENDILARHAERRRAFLAKTATTSPVVGLLLAQSARPARAATYSGGGKTTTAPDTTTVPFTTLFTGTIPATSAPTTLVTFPFTTIVTFPFTTVVTFPLTTLATVPFSVTTAAP